jgi:hypothetical protein
MWFALWSLVLGCSPDDDAPTRATYGTGQTDDPCESDTECAAGFACSADGECAPIPASCGDGEIDAGEVCDGDALGGATCESVVGSGGELGCLGDCSGYDTTSCTCTPWTCEDLGASCGPIDDGCGTLLECGTCDGWLECGVHEPNVCGADCPEGCPDGSTCSDLGVCESVDLADLVLDVVTVEVSGSVTLNGGAPSNLAGCSGPTDTNGTVTFVETTYGYVFSAATFCGGGFVYGPVSVFPGTYQVTVSGDTTDSNLPGQAYVAYSRLALE